MRKLPPLHALRAFEAAARQLSFTKAADELGLTPTAISHQVRHLEEVLQTSLFQRYPRPIRLTEEGARLYPVLRDSLDQIAAAIGQLSANEGDTPLRLSVTLAFASRWLMPRLATLRHETGLSIDVEADDKPTDLHTSGIDIAFRYAEKPTADAEWHRLFPDRTIAVAAPSLVQAAKPPTPEAILALPLLSYRWKIGAGLAPDWSHWQRLAGIAGRAPPIAQNFSEEIHAIDAAATGHGAVLASEVLVSGLLRTGELVRLSDIALPGRSYWAVFLPDHPQRDRLMTLLGWIRQHN